MRRFFLLNENKKEISVNVLARISEWGHVIALCKKAIGSQTSNGRRMYLYCVLNFESFVNYLFGTNAKNIIKNIDKLLCT